VFSPAGRFAEDIFTVNLVCTLNNPKLHTMTDEPARGHTRNALLASTSLGSIRLRFKRPATKSQALLNNCYRLPRRRNVVSDALRVSSDFRSDRAFVGLVRKLSLRILSPSDADTIAPSALAATTATCARGTTIVFISYLLSAFKFNGHRTGCSFSAYPGMPHTIFPEN
jgi:hypothetical protein